MKPEDCTGCRYLRPHVHMVSASGGCFKAPICGWVDRPVARVRSCHGPIPDPPPLLNVNLTSRKNDRAISPSSSSGTRHNTTRPARTIASPRRHSAHRFDSLQTRTPGTSVPALVFPCYSISQVPQYICLIPSCTKQ